MNRTQQREAARHAKAVADHERAEKRLVAAQNRWQKTRAALKRYEVKLDRQLLIGGSYDVRELNRAVQRQNDIIDGGFAGPGDFT